MMVSPPLSHAEASTSKAAIAMARRGFIAGNYHNLNQEHRSRLLDRDALSGLDRFEYSEFSLPHPN